MLSSFTKQEYMIFCLMRFLFILLRLIMYNEVNRYLSLSQSTKIGYNDNTLINIVVFSRVNPVIRFHTLAGHEQSHLTGSGTIMTPILV